MAYFKFSAIARNPKASAYGASSPSSQEVSLCLDSLREGHKPKSRLSKTISEVQKGVNKD